MAKVNVLQIGLSSYPGGVENAIMNYFRCIDRTQIHFDFICTEDSLAYTEEIEQAGSRIYYLPSPKQHMMRFAKELISVINSGGYDVVHVNLLSAVNIFPVLFSKFSHASRIIAHSHNSSLPGSGIKKVAHHALKHIIPMLTKDWIACSSDAAKWLFGHRKSSQVYILKNAISFERFCFNSNIRTAMRQRYGISEGVPVIGHVGRFNQEKNQEFLVNVFSSIKEVCPDAKLLLVGTGPLLNAVQHQVAKLNLSDSVIFVGGVEDTSAYYQMMDLFCLPSFFEGLGIVAVEAQASGLACICSTGVPQEAIFCTNAKRIDLKDPGEWIFQIKSMIYSKRISSAKPLLAQAGFDVVVEAKKLELYYLKGTVNEISKDIGDQS